MIKGVHPSRITQLINAKVIKAMKIGRDWFIEQKDLDEARWNTKPGPRAKD